MTQKRSFLYSIVNVKCPRCREGDMFPKGTLYSTNFADMNKHCSCCGQVFEPEVGYYYGAMYVSFAFNVAIFLVGFFVLHQLMEEVSVAIMVSLMAVTVIGLLPVIFRLSRVLWINIFFHYEGPSDLIPKKAHMLDKSEKS